MPPVDDFATILAAIVATMNSVPNIGAVHDYERYAKDSATLRAHYGARIDGVDQLRGWFVTRLSVRNARNGFGGPLVTTIWQVRGYMALNDAEASEKTFHALIQALIDAFWADQDLGGTVISTQTADPNAAGLTLEDAGPVFFSGVLCHSARLTLRTEHVQR